MGMPHPPILASLYALVSGNPNVYSAMAISRYYKQLAKVRSACSFRDELFPLASSYPLAQLQHLPTGDQGTNFSFY